MKNSPMLTSLMFILIFTGNIFAQNPSKRKAAGKAGDKQVEEPALKTGKAPFSKSEVKEKPPEKNSTLKQVTPKTKSSIDAEESKSGLESTENKKSEIFKAAAASGVSFVNSSGDTLMQVQEDGNVGIGLSSPARQLHIAETGDQSSMVVERTDGQFIQLHAGSARGTIGFEDTGEFRLGPVSAIGLTPDRTLSLTIGAAGNVGIGLDDATSKLEVDGTVTATAFVGDASGLTGISSDDLGNHTATQTLNLNGNYLSGDGDSEGIIVDGSGQIGIGTASPGSDLEIQSDNAFGTMLHVNNVDNSLSTGDFGPLVKINANDLGGANSLIGLAVDISDGSINHRYAATFTGGNVGIGTDSPNEQLEITGNFRLPVSTATSGVIYSDGDRFIHNFGGFSNFFAGVNAGNFSSTGISNIGIGPSALNSNTTGGGNTAIGSYALNNNTEGNNNFAIGAAALNDNTTGASNIALGTEALGNNISGSNNIAIGFEALHPLFQSGSDNIALGNSAGSSATGDNNILIGNDGTENQDNVIYLGNSSHTKTILSGEVGIGTTTPDWAFHVEDSQSGSEDFIAMIENTANDNTARNEGLLVRAGHNTYNSSQQSSIIQFETPNGAYIGRIAQDGASHVDYRSASDRRLKENIRPTRYGLTELLEIEVRDYNYITDQPSHVHTGFIAQQLNTAYPPAVGVGGEDVNTEPWEVAYGSLTPILVQAVQDQQELIEALTKKVAKVDKLEKQLAAIMQKLQGMAVKTTE